MKNRSAHRQIRVVLVEDASAQRTQLVSALQLQGDIEVQQSPARAREAVELVASTRPDVVILDLHLSDGRSQEAIKQIMAYTPTPILVLSAAIDDRRSPSAVEALVSGALEALPRPALWTPEQGAELRRVVRQISSVPVIRHPRGSLTAVQRGDAGSGGVRLPVVAVAASTGGPRALATLLAGLGGLEAAVLVVQHLHADFTAGLVQWMARVAALPVETADHQMVARPGRVYFAPGEHHLRYASRGRLELSELPLTAHRPSADELFTSVATNAGSSAVGVLLTGMGNDGAQGLLAIQRRGGQTFAQDEASSTVFGMPKAAVSVGAVTELLPLDKLADAIQRAVRTVRR